jgi:hypothetical protein
VLNNFKRLRTTMRKLVELYNFIRRVPNYRIKKNIYFNRLKATEGIMINCKQIKLLTIHSLHFKYTLMKCAMIFYKFNIQ